MFLSKNAGVKFDFNKIFLKPSICAIICGVAAYSSHGLLAHVLNYKLATVIAIMLAILVYGAALLLTGAISKEDFTAVPKLKKIERILEKYKLIK